MKKPSRTSKNEKTKLLALYSEFGTWPKVSEKISNGHKIDPSLLRRIAKGQKRAPNSVLAALGFPLNTVAVPPCKKCGEGHPTKRCTHRKTFDEHAADYEAWKIKNAQKLNAIVEWAESRTE
jgi:hypothetical protein